MTSPGPPGPVAKDFRGESEVAEAEGRDRQTDLQGKWRKETKRNTDGPNGDKGNQDISSPSSNPEGRDKGKPFVPEGRT